MKASFVARDKQIHIMQNLLIFCESIAHSKMLTSKQISKIWGTSERFIMKFIENCVKNGLIYNMFLVNTNNI